MMGSVRSRQPFYRLHWLSSCVAVLHKDTRTEQKTDHRPDETVWVGIGRISEPLAGRWDEKVDS